VLSQEELAALIDDVLDPSWAIHPRGVQVITLPALKSRGPAAAAACALAVVCAAAAPARSAALPGPAPQASVPAEPVPAGAQALGPTAASTTERVSFVLKARRLQRLEFGVESGLGHGDLSVRQFARAYGRPAAGVSALRRYLARYGITTFAYPDRLDVSATGTAAQFESALGAAQEDYLVPAVPAANGQRGIAAQRIHAPRQAATLPRSLARFVLCIFGLSNYSSATSDLTPAPEAAAAAAGAKFTANDKQTPAAFARDYGLDRLYARGADGAGQTIGIVALASMNPSVPAYFWRHYLHLKDTAKRITVVNVDGGAGPVSLANGSDETTLDVEQSGGVAPGAHIVVYQAPSTDAGFADAFYDAASQNVAGSVSTSFAASETLIAGEIAARRWPATYVAAFDQAFLELAAQGQAAFAATGDAGAYEASSDAGTTNLSVQSPADSPFITAVGGTTRAGTIAVTAANGTKTKVTVPAQRAWGWDYAWSLWKIFGAASEAQFAEGEAMAGGGGGYSAVEPMPLYQRFTRGTREFQAVQYLTPAKYKNFYGLILPTAWKFDPTPPVTSGTGNSRAVPDLSASADPLTGGYEVYDPQYKPTPVEGLGGTSFVAPQFNGSAAVIDSYLGRRTGFWNPAIYQFASEPGSPFTPLGVTGARNDNLYYTGTPGQTYNVGTGLGVPDLFRLAEDFAPGQGPR
jgi:kumamolisin